MDNKCLLCEMSTILKDNYDCWDQQWHIEMELVNGDKLSTHIQGSPNIIVGYYRERIQSLTLVQIK